MAAPTFSPKPSGLTKAPKKEHPAAPGAAPIGASTRRTVEGSGSLKPMTVRLPAQLAKSAKVRAVEEGRPLQELVADALAEYLRT